MLNHRCSKVFPSKLGNVSRLSIPIVLTLVCLFAGCGKGRKGEMLTPSESLRHAIITFENEDYLKAQDEFSAITLNYPGSVVVDSAEFYLGETHFAMKEYILAASSYERVVTQYPRSRLVPRSQFKIGESYYQLSPIYALDQDYTRKAITELQRFLEDYPDDEMRSKAEEYLFLCRQKLARKEYSAGIIYIRIAAYSSAVIYFDEILNNYYDTKYAPMALYQKGIALQKDKKYDEALTVFNLFLSKYPNHSYRFQAEERIKTLQHPESEEASKDG